jgi:hypothetical protein
MSSLVAWFMMGMYPMIPGVGGVALASPSFPSIVLHLPGDKTFTITTSGSGHYIQSAQLNGAATTSLWLPASTLLAGGTLDFTLGAQPSMWGSAPGDAPPSFGPGQFATVTDAFNSRGIASNSAPAVADYDGFGWTYSQEALASVVTGSSVSFNGVQFSWPAAGSTLDNFVPSGQSLSLSATQKGGTIHFLGSACAGPSSGTGMLGYSDGTSTPFTLAFSDWTLAGGTVQPLAGEQIAITTAYRNSINGQTDPTKTYVFYTAVPLDAGKTLASVTLPPTVSAGRIHVFSLALTP